MGFPHNENWDAPTAPALPSGWNNPSGFFATTSGTLGGAFTAGPISSPNVLVLPAGDGGPNAITYGSIDTVGGDIALTGSVLFDAAFAFRSAGVFWRCNASTLVIGTSNYYLALLDGYGATLTWYAQVGGTTYTIGGVSSITLGANDWYVIGPSSASTATTITLQRVSDGKYWYSGAWNTSPGNAISGTDSTVTGAGYAGYLGTAGLASDIVFDDWDFGSSAGGDTLNAAPGAYLVTGVAATLEHDRKLPGAAGAIAVTGVNASLTAAATLPAAAGAYGVTGVTASLLDAHKLTAGVGSIAVTGINAALQQPTTLSAATGAIAVTGVNADLEWGHVAFASPGGYAVTGIAADLFAGGDVLLAAPGSYVVGRIAASLTAFHTLFGSVGSYVVGGINAALEQPETLSASTGSYVVGGIAAELGRQIAEAAGPGVYLVTGIGAVLVVEPVGGGTGPVAYHVYSNTGVGDPINYETPIDATSGLTYTTAPLSYPGTWSFGVRAFYVDSDLEEQNLDCSVTIVLSAAGLDISNQPLPPFGLRAIPIAQGAIRAEWFTAPVTGPKAPAGYHVYVAIGTLSYSSPAATVAFSSGIANSFVANMTGFTGGTVYTVGVRAFNAVAEETNTTTVTVTPIGAGPSAVQCLVGIAVA